VEVRQVEGTRKTASSAGDLKIPSRGEPPSTRKLRVKSGARVQGVAGEVAEDKPVVVSEIARLDAPKQAPPHLGSDSCTGAENRLALDVARAVRPRQLGRVKQVEGGIEPLGDDFLVGEERELGAMPIRGRAARLVHESPMRLEYERQAKRRLVPVEHAVA